MSKPESAAVDDADLEDLLDHKTDGTEETPLDLDHLTKGQLDVPRRRSSSPGLGSLVSAHCRYLCYMYPRCCGCVSVGTVALVMFFLIGLILDPKDTYGVIKNDYTNIQSEYDLSLGKIDHWCLKGDDMSCRCEDPLEPQSRMEFKTWVNAYNENKKTVEAYVDSEMVDVAFIGESIVEEMDGRWMGRTQGDDLKGIEKSFKRQFKRTKSGFEGVALGIAGDTSPNVLWRLLHGEMPADFNPRVWWVMLGMNDLGRMQCSEEVVVLGILRVVEEIRTRKPDAKIVINSMLPMADLRGGAFPTMVEYKDAIVQRNKKMRGFSKTTNPDLFARGPDGVAGTASAAKPVEYKRPESTTKALRYRRKKQFRNKKYPKMKKENEKGGNTEKEADDRRERLHRLLESKRNLKKRRDEDDEEGETNGVGTSDKKELTKEQIAALGAFLKKIKKDPVNPKLSVDKSVVRRRDPKRLFMAKNRLPLFKSIFAINSQLRRFADKHDNISFFDATKIFTERGENGKYVLQSERISIRGHPTLVGFEKLEEAMALKLKKMFEKEDIELKVEVEAAEEEEKEEDEAKEKEQKIEKKKIEESEEDDPDEKEEASGIEKKTDDKADASKEDETEKSEDKDSNSEKEKEEKEEESKEEEEEEESKEEESKKEESKEEESEGKKDEEEEDEESNEEEKSEDESEESEDE